MTGNALHFRDHRLVAQQISHFELGIPGLTGAEQFAGAANLQIFLRNHKAVVTVAQHLQAFLRGFRQR